MGKLTLEQKVDLLIKWRKEAKAEIQDLWDRINGDTDAAVEFAEQTRDIAERARRLAGRVDKTLKGFIAED